MRSFITLALVAIITSLTSDARALSKEFVDAKLAECEKHNGESVNAGQNKILCRMNVQLRALSIRMEELESQAKTAKGGDHERVLHELKTAREGRRELAEQLRKLMEASKAQAQAAPAQERPPKARPKKPPKERKQPRVKPKTAPRPARRAPRRLAQSGFGVVERPGQYAATTFKPRGVPNFHRLTELARGLDEWLRAVAPAQVRIVLVKNGQPVRIAHPGGQFNTFYGDLNGDGKPEPTPYAGVDPSLVRDLYIPWRRGDQVQLVLLTDTGLGVSIPGRPIYPLWGNAVRVEPPPAPGPGQWKTPAHVATVVGWR